MKVYGQLEKAQLENVTSDTASLPAGMVQYRTDTKVAKVSDGSTMKEIVDTSSTQTLAGKTLTTPSISAPAITSEATLTQIATPSTPASGFTKFYSKSDGAMYYLTPAGVETRVSSPSNLGFVTKTTSYTLTTSDEAVEFNLSTDQTATLPTAVGITGKVFTLLNKSAAAGVTVTPFSGESIAGLTASKFLREGESMQIISNGTGWDVVSFKGRGVTTASSAQKTPAGGTQFQSLSGNSITLTRGRWLVYGSAFFVNRSGGALSISRCGVNLYSANGADSGTPPANLSSVSNTSLLSVGNQSVTFGSFSGNTADQAALQTGSVILDVVSATSGSIYVVTYLEATNPTDARINAYINAVKIGD